MESGAILCSLAQVDRRRSHGEGAWPYGNASAAWPHTHVCALPYVHTIKCMGAATAWCCGDGLPWCSGQLCVVLSASAQFRCRAGGDAWQGSHALAGPCPACLTVTLCVKKVSPSGGTSHVLLFCKRAKSRCLPGELLWCLPSCLPGAHADGAVIVAQSGQARHPHACSTNAGRRALTVSFSPRPRHSAATWAQCLSPVVTHTCAYQAAQPMLVSACAPPAACRRPWPSRSGAGGLP